MNRPRKILAAVDLSSASERVVGAAILLGQAFDASVHVLHARELFAYPTTGGELPLAGSPEESASVVDEAVAAIAGRFSAAGVPCVMSTVDGPAGTAIMAKADELNADVIVVGTHGRTGAAHALLGSVAERVVQRAHRPVLVVPAR
jgi:nucleotide-binding universal stress UspA family protein